MKYLKIFLIALVFSGVALGLESYTSFRTDHAQEATKVQPVSIVVKGTTDDTFYYLEADPSSGALPVSASTQAKSVIELIRNDYSSTNVTTSAYVELVASTSGAIYTLNVFDSSGETLVLATGAAASESDLIYIPPGGNDRIDVFIAAGTRLSVKAVSADATTGEIVINATD